jgi:hypothetical protein
MGVVAKFKKKISWGCDEAKVWPTYGEKNAHANEQNPGGPWP